MASRGTTRSAWFIILLIILIINIYPGNGRPIIRHDSVLNDIIDDQSSTGRDHHHINLKTTTVTCEATYGFLPCTTTFWGLLFMIFVYEVLLSVADGYISAGSDIFFQIFGTGFFGASLFQLLGTVPQVGLIIVTGIASSSESVAEQAVMSMGLLAGTAIMSLTLTWGSVILFGNFDLSQPPLPPDFSDLQQFNSKPFSLTGCGITCDVQTRTTARIMLVSLIPFLILQLAKLLNSPSGIRIVILVSLLVSAVFLAVYCIYQGFQPWIQNRRLEFVVRKYTRNKLVQSLLTAGSRPNIPVIKEVFHRIDQNGNSYISAAELRALIVGIQIEETGSNKEDVVKKVMEEFDVSGDSQLNELEFVKGLSKWLITADSVKGFSKGKQKLFHFNRKKTAAAAAATPNTTTSEEQQSLIARKKKITKAVKLKNLWNYIKASLLIALGASLAVVLAEPLMDIVQEFSVLANVPSFLISYVVIPLALNFRQALSAIKSAQKKTENAISLALSEIYNGVFLNNMMGLIMFLGIVYIRNLSWDVSAEVLVVLIICTVMGAYTSISTRIPVWTSFVAFALYPISLLFVYVLTADLGWN